MPQSRTPHRPRIDALHRSGMADTPAASPTCGATAAPVLGKRHSREDDAARLPCSAARSLLQPSCRVVRGWEFDARDVNSSNMYAVLHDVCDDTDEIVHIDHHATVRDRYHANGWVRQARRSSAPLSPATMDRFKQAVREQREAGYVVHVERYNELIRSAQSRQPPAGHASDIPTL